MRITRISEGDVASPGLNFIRISDGGFALRWMGKTYSLYARLRGRANRTRPRVYGHIEKRPPNSSISIKA